MFNNIEDVQNAVTTYLAGTINASSSQMAKLHKELVDITFSLLMGKSLKNLDFLEEALKVLSITSTPSESKRILEVVSIERQGKLVRLCMIKVPDLSQSDKQHVANLGQYLLFAQVMLGISEDNFSLELDSKLGTICPLPEAVQTAMAKLVTAARSTEGFYPGEKIRFESGYVGSLPEVIAALRSLYQNSPFVRKTSAKATNAEILRESINTSFALKKQGGNPFIENFVKGVMRELTNTRDTHFPASFFKAAKIANKVSSTDGILQKLGYVPKMPSTQKVIQIYSNFYSKKEEKEALIETPTSKTPHENSHKEFGAAVKLLLPKISCSSNKSCKEQLKSDSIRTTNQNMLQYYNKHTEAVNEVNKTYAFLVAAKNPKNKKAKPIHFKNEKDRTSNLVYTKMDFLDSDGKKYHNYKDIPANVRKYLQKILHKKIKLVRTTGESHNDETNTEEMETEETSEIQVATAVQEPPMKKSKGKQKALTQTKSMDE
jgi:hypothetical protein